MCPDPQFHADLITLTEDILKGKLHFLCSDQGITDTLIKLMLTIDNNESQRNVFYLRSFDLCHRKKKQVVSKENLS